MTMDPISKVPTRVLILSDTHGDDVLYDGVPPGEKQIDVVIHCGDLTEESKLHEFRASLALLQRIEAPLKLVIAGNHDFTLDKTAFTDIIQSSQKPIEASLIKQEFGEFGEALELLTEPSAGITFLHEGNHTFRLNNGALLRVYASPYTPSKSNWGFTYSPNTDHEWAIAKDTDIVVTHGPPQGVLDRTQSRERAGSPSLFAAVARARPMVHCFGHIHEAWGARLVRWRDALDESVMPSHFNAIDNGQSKTIASLSTLVSERTETEVGEDNDGPDPKPRTYAKAAISRGGDSPGEVRTHTMFVNASIQGLSEGQSQLPWIVDLDLCPAD